jgi:hypothetical protein
MKANETSESRRPQATAGVRRVGCKQLIMIEASSSAHPSGMLAIRI